MKWGRSRRCSTLPESVRRISNTDCLGLILILVIKLPAQTQAELSSPNWNADATYSTVLAPDTQFIVYTRRNR